MPPGEIIIKFPSDFNAPPALCKALTIPLILTPLLTRAINVSIGFVPIFSSTPCVLPFQTIS